VQCAFGKGWAVDTMSRPSDGDGWYYAPTFEELDAEETSSASMTAMTYVRRRRWAWRPMAPLPVAISAVPEKEKGALETAAFPEEESPSKAQSEATSLSHLGGEEELEDEGDYDAMCREQERLMVQAAKDAPPIVGDPIYIVSARWMRVWDQFMATGAPNPGPISNAKDLLVLAAGDCVPRPGLKYGEDYVKANSGVWEILLDIYGCDKIPVEGGGTGDMQSVVRILADAQNIAATSGESEVDIDTSGDADAGDAGAAVDIARASIGSKLRNEMPVDDDDDDGEDASAALQTASGATQS